MTWRTRLSVSTSVSTWSAGRTTTESFASNGASLALPLRRLKHYGPAGARPDRCLAAGHEWLHPERRQAMRLIPSRWTRTPQPARPELHVLIVHDDGDDGRSYFIEHPESCPYDHDDSFVIGGKFYRCDVGHLWTETGEHAIAGYETLAPGRYAIQAEYSHVPSTVNGPEEWDAWLEVGS